MSMPDHGCVRDFGNNVSDIETARLRLAEHLLSIANKDSNDVASLKAQWR